LPEHRQHGYASAVVLRAVHEARAAGARLVFLVADAEDWPKELYRRLGFEEIGENLKLLRTTTAS
jgi:ribosomal protein S18 acetylase RimI-like enzyme